MHDARTKLTIEQMQEKSREQHGLTVAKLTQMLLDDRAGATGEKKYSASVRAAEVIAKLNGLLVDKSEITGAGGAPIAAVVNVTIDKGE